jgi:transcription initiation factor TFIIB
MHSSIVCLSCNSGSLITDADSGEVICSHCGQVMIDRNNENRPEWRSFSSGARVDAVATSNTTGLPTSLARHDMGLATIIGRINIDASGHALDPAMRSTMDRLRLWD